jgi:protein-disulfide isomerase
VLLGAAGVVAAIGIAIALVVVLTGGNSSSAPKNVPAVGSLTNALTLPGASDVNALYKGIPQNGMTLGSPEAPVTMTEFIDLQCPVCQAFETETLPGVVKKYVRPGKVKIVMRPWAFIGPDSIRGQSAVLAAGLQNKGFDYASLLYGNQGGENTGWLDDNMVAAAAASIPGLETAKLLSDRNSATVDGQAKDVDSEAQAGGVNSTPTILVGKTGTPGKVVALNSPTDRQTLDQAIDAAVANAK